VRAKHLLEDMGGVAVRATGRPASPSARATCGPSTACCETGYRYSSSIYPIQHDHYGMPDAPRFAHRAPGLLEVPVTTVRMFEPQSAVQRGWLLPAVAVCPVALDAAARQPARRQPGDLLFPPVGNRPGQPRIPGISLQDALSATT
jgi:hypothetical protein